MRRRQYVSRVAALGAPLVAGCTGGRGAAYGDDGGGATSTTAPETTTAASAQAMVETTVEMKNTTFDPAKTEVDVGATVRWVNEDPFQHNVTSTQFSEGAAWWDFTQTLASGESTTHTFDTKGVYEYYCTIHGQGTMCGVVLVGYDSYDGCLPCERGGGDESY